MPQPPESPAYVSRAGAKLAFALDAFQVQPDGLTAADFGSNVGGFVDCLLQRGAAKVYAIDTGYGILAWKLRQHARVVVMERTNVLRLTLPEQVDLVTIDAGWTRQEQVLPAAARVLRPGGRIVSLVKPHYESTHALRTAGVLPPDVAHQVLAATVEKIAAMGFTIHGQVESPLRGQHGNVEFLLSLLPPPGGKV